MIDEDVETAAPSELVELELVRPDDPDPDSTPFSTAPLDIVTRSLPKEEGERRG